MDKCFSYIMLIIIIMSENFIMFYNFIMSDNFIMFYNFILFYNFIRRRWINSFLTFDIFF